MASSPAPAAPRVQDANALPAGTRLGEFELRQVLGVGGFGIVYLAFDHALEREVAVKEYMPASLAGRTETMHVSLRSQSDAETFALGLRSFVNEARLLARFDHPALLKVLRFWEANGTAYMAMPVLRGQTLKEKRIAEGRAPAEAELRAMLLHLLGALERLHGEGVFHRDIAPDNIQIEPDGHPVLLDFGAARRVLNDKTQTLTAILKPAYAPIEQYAETGSVKQGPWTDFYALGATLHYVLLGRPPAPATARTVSDEASALASLGLPGYSPAFLQMVDWMLAPRPADRPQSAAELRQVLQGDKTVPPAFVVQPSGQAWDTTQILPRSRSAGPDATQLLEQPHALRPDATAQTPGAPPAGVAADLDLDTAAVPATPAAATAAPAASAARRAARAAAAKPPPAAPARRAAWPRVAAAVTAVVAVVVAVYAFGTARTSAPTAGAGALPQPAVAADGTATGLQPASTLLLQPSASAAASPVPLLASATTAPGATSGATAAVAATAGPAGAESMVKPAQPVTARPAPARAAAGPGAAASPVTAPAGAAAPPANPATTDPAYSAGGNTAPAAGAVAAPAGAGTAPASTAAAPAGITAAPEAAEAAAAGPEAKCAGRNALSYFVCMERECLRSSFASHADCKAWRKDAKRE